MSGRRSRRILVTLGRMTALGVLVAVGLCAYLWVEHRSSITLPSPSGAYAVGRVIYDWIDDTAVDSLAPESGTRRELLVWIWYPGASRAGETPAPFDDYVPASLRPRTPVPRGPLLFEWLTRDLARVRGHSLRDAAVASGEAPYPVAVMRAGASAPVLAYSTLAEDLASHGYIVVGFDAPYRTWRVVFPDGRVVERTPENNPELFAGEELVRVGDRLVSAWTRDVAFVVDRLERLNADDPSGLFTGRIDATRVGVFGHSLGGATAAQFCHDDSRCVAAIDIDGRPLGSVVRTGLDKPFMFLLSDHADTASDPEARRINADIQAIYDALPVKARYRVAIRGANHFTFSDDGALLKSRVLRGALRLFGKLHISGRRQLAVTAHCIDAFFDAYLKPGGGPPPSIVSPEYPEIEPFD